MARPADPVLQQIHQLDRGSPDFRDQLNAVFRGRDYEDHKKGLVKSDLVWFVDYLDGVLESLDPFDVASRKCMRELGSLCRDNAILPTSYTISPDRVTRDEIPFSSGGFGDVYRGVYNGSDVCIKRMREQTQDPPDKLHAFCKEAVMWKYLKHQNILPLIGVSTSPIQLISKWMPGGNLSEYIGEHPEADRVRLLFEVAEGLSYLHAARWSTGILREYLNVLIDVSENPPRALIMDLGTAIVTKNIDSERPPTTQDINTPRWAAPEVLNGENPTTKSDVHSFAMIMIEVFTGQVPFKGVAPWPAAMKILTGKRPGRPAHPSCTDVLWALIQRCWNQDPALRPKISEASAILLSSSAPPN